MLRANGRLALLLVMIALGTSVASRAQASGDEVWSEGGLRVQSKFLQLDLTGGQRARVKLIAAKSEITVEASTFVVMGGNKSGMVIKSMGPATIAASDGRRMNADSIEVWLSLDGWGYFKAIRRVVLR